MDNLDAPQWADFNASLMSDIEEFFNTEHEMHEPRKNSEITRYDSFADSHDSRSSVSSAAYGSPKSNFSSPMPKSNFSSLTPKSNFSSPTPKSNFSSPTLKSNFSSPTPKSNFSSPIPPRNFGGDCAKKSDEVLSSAIRALRLNSETKIRVRSSMTPGASRNVNRISSSVAENSSTRRSNDEIDESENKIEENLLYRENTEEDMGDNNRTLVAIEDDKNCDVALTTAEKSEDTVGVGEKLVIRCEEDNLAILDSEADTAIFTLSENKSEDVISDAEKLKLAKLESRLDPSKRPIFDKKKKEENLRTSQPEADTAIFTLSENKSEDVISDAEKLKLAKLESRLDPSKRPIFDKKKKEENLRTSQPEADTAIFTLSENKSEDVISDAEKSKLAKLESRLDPSKRPIFDKKKKEENLRTSQPEADKPIFTLPENKPEDKISKRPIHDKKIKETVSVSSRAEINSIISKTTEFKSEDKISADRKSKLAKFVAQPDTKLAIPEKKKQRENHQISKPEEKSNLAKLVAQSEPGKRAITEKKNPSSRAPKPRVLTSHARRQSLSKYRRRSNQYVSLAEAVSKFQTGTPKRFRSSNRRDDKTGPLLKVKQTTMKLTCPMSPALRCKHRARPVSVPNAEEREKLEIEAIRKNRVRPNPVKPRATNIRGATREPRREVVSSAGKKSTALSQPSGRINEKAFFERKSTMDRDGALAEAASSSELKTEMNPPKATPSRLPNPSTSTDRKLTAPGDYSTAERRKEASLVSTSVPKHTPCKKMIPSVVSTEEGTVIKNVEILHFGIPIDNDYRNKNITRTMPFSFDTRNRESQSRKEKLKTQRSEEETRKPTFHARPAPSFAKTPSRALASPRDGDNEPEKPMLCPLSFQERNELLLRKKKKMIEDTVEREKRARVFHAKPAPTLKPVFVRGASAENLRANAADDKSKKRGLSPAARLRGRSQEFVVSDQENRAPNVGANMQCPKLKNPLIGHNLVIKKSGGK